MLRDRATSQATGPSPQSRGPRPSSMERLLKELAEGLAEARIDAAEARAEAAELRATLAKRAPPAKKKVTAKGRIKRSALQQLGGEPRVLLSPMPMPSPFAARPTFPGFR